MAQPLVKPVRDSVPRVADDVAVGEDLNFQRKWWRFERGLWIFFLIILVCDLLGMLGHGWLSKARRSTPDHSLTVEYERIERASTPSIMVLQFEPSAVHNGRIQLFVSTDVIRRLGAQRISPQPAVSALTDGGVTYLFPAAPESTVVEIALQPIYPGREHFRVQVPGSEPIDARIFVLP